MNPPSERLFPRLPLAKTEAGASPGAAAFLKDLIDACVMESYFREHMAERDLLFHDTMAPHLTAYAPEASAAQQHDFLTHEWERMKYEGRSMKWGGFCGAFSSFIIHPSTLGPAPSHPIRNRLLTADSPDLLAIIKQAG